MLIGLVFVFAGAKGWLEGRNVPSGIVLLCGVLLVVEYWMTGSPT
jgi:hypothetical protein